MTTQSEAIAVFEGLYATDGEIITNGNRLAAFVAENGTSIATLAALGVPYVVIVDLTAEQIATANTAPIVDAVPSPGSGKGWHVVDAQSQIVPGSTPFEGSPSAEIYYTGDTGSGIQLLETSIGIGGEDPFTNIILGSPNTTDISRERWEDKGLTIKSVSDDATPGANGTCRIWITVQLRTLP